MESLFDLKVLIGALVVALVAATRFNSAPPVKPVLPDNTPRPLGMLKVLLQFREEPGSLLFPPPRAQTTFFKFELYRLAYALTGVAVYVVLSAIPGVAAEVDAFLRAVGSEKIPSLVSGGPILIALVVAVVFPAVPPFRAAERAIRRSFYERASIPAQQLRERHRLKHAPYVAHPATLKLVRDSLAQEDFARDDLGIDDTPTTRSLWTKAALLMAHVERWQGEDRYKTAFATLREKDGVTRSVVRLGETYEALKPDARACLEALREQPGQPGTDAREVAFRHASRDFLVAIYDFLSRISLHAHYTDHDRVRRMRGLGFLLSPDESGPIPDPNDVAALGVLIAAVVFLPLSHQTGAGRAVLISVEVGVAVLAPILIAARFPSFAARRPGGTPGLAFPLVAGLVAAAAGVVAHTLVLSGTATRPWLDLAQGWAAYTGRSYPWTLQLFLLAALIAGRMRASAYPDPLRLQGLGRIRQWGSVVDAGLFLSVTLVLVGVYIRPTVAHLSGVAARADDWSLLLLPAVIAAAIGFFVPTWYRAHAWRQAAPAPLPAFAGDFSTVSAAR
jgi:hypothetical protein